MNKRTLGNSDMGVTPAGFWAWAIVGARSPKQVEGIIDALKFRLSEDEIAEIEAKLKE